MLSSIVRWYATRIKVHKYYGSLACNNYTLIGNQCPSKQLSLQCMILKHSILHRNFGNMENNEILFPPLLPGPVNKSRKLWSLMSLPMTNIFLRYKGYGDFDFVTVKKAATEAALKVSQDLSEQNYNHLEDLVEKTMLKMLEIRISSLTEEQRKLIAIKEEDIFISQISYLNISELSSPSDFILEMSIMISYIPNFGKLSKQQESDFTVLKDLKRLIGNYIFSRNYTKDGFSDWIITYVNVIE